jgi:hypothetical protein
MSKYVQWSHPDWHDFFVTLDDEDGRQEAEDYCPDSPELLVKSPIELTDAEYEALNDNFAGD